ncbi:MAG: ABC transporter ATP-binding protein [Lachnospiraceae bacterium]|nr:ABC transporter ATP-binding protein [Lachnospiraceae bacterium]
MKKIHVVFSNVIYVIRHSLKVTPLILFSSLMVSGMSVLLSMLEAYLPSMVVRGIEEKWPGKELVFGILGVAAGFILIRLMSYFFSILFTVQKSDCRLGFTLALNRCVLESDYQFLEQQKTQIRIDQVADMLYAENDFEGIGAIWVGIRDLLLTAVGVAAASAILHKLNWGMILFVIVVSLLNTVLSHSIDRYIKAHRDQWGRIDKKIHYIAEKLVFKEYAKEIKEYYCEDWIIGKMSKLISERGNWYTRIQNKTAFLRLLSTVVNLGYDIIVMGYVVYNVFQGKIAISECVLFIGVIAQLAGFMSKGFGAVNLLIRGSYDMEMVRDVIDEQLETGRKTGLLEKIGQGPIEIRFEHVSFRYESEGEDVISDLNLTIKKGEKLAIVGENGAGKTTLVKLMTGMYTPTEGRICYNGIPIHEYERNEIYQLISAAFQDCVIYPFSIADNIVLGNPVRSEELIRKCMKDVGLEKYIPRINDMLISEASENAIDLSGGERQRLLIARAIYKNTPVLVLDEPTAALDAVAESELYLLYKKFAENKTSLFISHRLASTRFCDRIIFLKNGRILEEGTHEHLMEEKKEYAKLFELQSRYYKKGQELLEE